MDRTIKRRYSARYLPDDLNAYSSEFDEYGKWVYVRDYGYCWTPTAISAEWAPYRLGRWTWIGGDYVWISYEPWGWTPYHYEDGRMSHPMVGAGFPLQRVQHIGALDMWAGFRPPHMYHGFPWPPEKYTTGMGIMVPIVST